MNAMTETQKAYLAGIFDGDGCVSIVKSNKPPYGMYHQLAVMFTQSSLPYLEAIREIAGVGKIYEQTGVTKLKRNRSAYIWRIPSRAGAILIEELLPYLIRKRRQAEIAVEFQNTMTNSGGAGTPDEVIENRESLYEEIRKWKHTGEL